MPSQQESRSQSIWGELAVIAAQYIVSSALAGDEPEQPQQMAGSLYQPTQLPQEQPFQPSGLPQPPQYGQTPPAITQFPPFQPLFGQRRIGQ